jgi:hypothetical protein
MEHVAIGAFTKIVFESVVWSQMIEPKLMKNDVIEHRLAVHVGKRGGSVRDRVEFVKAFYEAEACAIALTMEVLLDKGLDMFGGSLIGGH